MSPLDLQGRRLALGYSINLMAEILRVDAETLLGWESGRVEIDDPEWLSAALSALANARQSSSPVCELVILE